MQYYHAENAGRGKIGGVMFTIYGIIAGTAVGVYATDNTAEISALDSLASVPTSAVTKIDELDYEIALKKKTSSYRHSITSTPKQPERLLQGNALRGDGAVHVVDEPQEPEEPISIRETVDSVQDALKVAVVNKRGAKTK